jgi:hypothetical protein
MTKKKRLRKLERLKKIDELANPINQSIIKNENTHAIPLLEKINFGNIQIVRPKTTSEWANKIAAEAHLRAAYEAGFYTELESINEILTYLVAFFESRLDNAITHLSSWELLHFLLHEYGVARKIVDMHRRGHLSAAEEKKWVSECQFTRRAYKFLCERVVLLSPKQTVTSSKNVATLASFYDDAIISAEQLINFSVTSDQTYHLFPDTSVFEILPKGMDHYWDLRLANESTTDSLLKKIQERIGKDAKSRDSNFKGTSFDENFQLHDSIIGDAFEEIWGIRYANAVKALASVPKISSPGELGICCVRRSELIHAVALNEETTLDAVEKIFSGFLLSAENMKGEARHFWNPKNEYRAYRRGMFEIGDNSDKRITWSKEMYIECWFMLLRSTAYGIVPPEWKHSSLNTPLGTLKNECGKWFERVVRDRMRSMGMEAICSRRSFGLGPQRIESVHGEIDLVAYSEKEQLLIIGECKMTMTGAEPKFFRDELEDFVRKPKSHANRFRKKLVWIQENIDSFCIALDSAKEFGCKIRPTHIAPVMITFIPSIASYFISDFPCVALSELVDDYKEKDRWEYLRIPI